MSKTLNSYCLQAHRNSSSKPPRNANAAATTYHQCASGQQRHRTHKITSTLNSKHARKHTPPTDLPEPLLGFPGTPDPPDAHVGPHQIYFIALGGVRGPREAQERLWEVCGWWVCFVSLLLLPKLRIACDCACCCCCHCCNFVLR